MTIKRIDAVDQINALTKRWLATAGGDAAVLSAAGVWPLLAFLADGADEQTGAALGDALGIPARDAALAAREVLAALADSPSVRTALGLWTREEVRLKPDWLGGLPGGVHGALTGDAGEDQARLDAWAWNRTGGLVPELPITLTAETMLVLASALSVTVAWREEFTESIGRSAGPWADARGSLKVLRRFTPGLDALRVAETPIGRISALTVEGDGEVDVHLVLGPPDRSATEVLTIGVDLAGIGTSHIADTSAGNASAANASGDITGAPRHPMTRGTELPVGEAGPGVRVQKVESLWPRDLLETTTVPFLIRARHDLLKDAALFGLQYATDTAYGHFPGISDFPLAVKSAAQSAIAQFTETGFKAAAVTALGAVAAGSAMPPTTHRVREVKVTFDRPFAYYAVHRDSGLILVAGWVAEPGSDHQPSSGSA